MKKLFEEIKQKTPRGLYDEYNKIPYSFHNRATYNIQTEERKVKNITLKALEEHIRKSSLSLKLDNSKPINIFVLHNVAFKRALLKTISNISLVRKKDKADYIIIDDQKIQLELSGRYSTCKNADIFFQIEWEDIPKLISIHTILYDNTSTQKIMTPEEYVRFKGMVSSKDSRIATAALDNLFDYSVEESCIFLQLLINEYKSYGNRITNDRPKLFSKKIGQYLGQEGLWPLINYNDAIYVLNKYPDKYVDQFLVNFNLRLTGYTVSRLPDNEEPPVNIGEETVSWEL